MSTVAVCVGWGNIHCFTYHPFTHYQLNFIFEVMHLKMEGTWETGLLRVSLFGMVVAWLSLLDAIFHIAKRRQFIIVNLTKVATHFGE